MTEPSALSDSQLMARAHLWRRKSMMGSRDAGSIARAHEIEMRRRLGGATTMGAPLAQGRAQRRKWWRLW
ncbi:hypothetical protein [Variovorax sp. dw_954]|uniref:hypothetical protein n=1 Tax=Variovorax sp. dw_954 TaxID=2720078 RepID=UPI001BD6A710|nr:hypothetical protein [Variovorax sp. dw_954]